MEAALWGWVERVKALLNANANADKRIRDYEVRFAMDLAKPTRKNEKERYRRARRAPAENVPERDRDRRHIVVLLGGSNSEKQHGYTGPLPESKRDNYGFRKPQSEMAIKLYGPIRSYHVPSITKTAAVLDRGDQFPRISATSGWGADALPLNYKTRPQWIEQVFYYIASTKLQDALDPDLDQGKPG